MFNNLTRERSSNQNPLQQALFNAAKAGNINLMLELIEEGADLFAVDGTRRNALSYAFASNREETLASLEKLAFTSPKQAGKMKYLHLFMSLVLGFATYTIIPEIISKAYGKIKLSGSKESAVLAFNSHGSEVKH